MSAQHRDSRPSQPVIGYAFLPGVGVVPVVDVPSEPGTPRIVALCDPAGYRVIKFKSDVEWKKAQR